MQMQLIVYMQERGRRVLHHQAESSSAQTYPGRLGFALPMDDGTGNDK